MKGEATSTFPNFFLRQGIGSDGQKNLTVSRGTLQNFMFRVLAMTTTMTMTETMTVTISKICTITMVKWLIKIWYQFCVVL